MKILILSILIMLTFSACGPVASPAVKAAGADDVKRLEKIVMSNPSAINKKESHYAFQTTPLLAAAQNGSYDSVDFLLSQNANPNIRSQQYQTRGMTALDLAKNNKHTDVVALLTNAGATYTPTMVVNKATKRQMKQALKNNNTTARTENRQRYVRKNNASKPESVEDFMDPNYNKLYDVFN